MVEEILRRAYVRDWPARLWAHVPGACEVRLVDSHVDVPGAGPDLTVAFASDLHLGPTTPSRLLDRAFERLAACAPDVLALGGDYVFLDATEAKARELAARVREVPAQTKVAVLGNHDLWTDHRLLERALERAGVQVLVDDAVRIGDVAVLGVDDPWTGAMDAERALSACGDATVIVAVAHAPEAIPALAGQVDALLCGHTHGGHLALPGGRPVVVQGAVGKRHAHGVHRFGRTTAIVSRGIGGIEIPMRAFAPPDVVRLRLVRREYDPENLFGHTRGLIR
ncbi:MAG: metallophosphoesterase family protein [Deltaproteobacteria bacterium]|nr:metallophosphoesterase family protein [Deltaproteobacteria bacterium]